MHKAEKINHITQLLHLHLKKLHRLFAKFSKVSNLTLQQAHILLYLAHHPGSIQKEIADSFNLRKSSVTSIVKNLEKDGYIIRKTDPESARNKRVYLTSKGEKQIDKLYQIFALIDTNLGQALTEDELDDLDKLISKLNNHIDKMLGSS